ncbi:MAG: DMT family transporter [Actinomycetota bacterium]|nr:DMT family transporter [Actinomycetota bacterium]
MGALLALASSLTWGVADFMGGLAARRVGPVHVLAVSYPAGAVVVTFFALFVIPGEISAGVLIWGTLSGIIGALGICLLYLALVHGPMGIVSPITAVLAGAVPAFVGLLRGESLSPLAIFGILCAGVAVVLVSRETGEHAKVTVSTIGLAAASGVAIGLYLTAIGLAPADSGVWAATFGRWVSTLIMLTVLVVFARPFVRQGFPWLLVIASGILDALANGVFQLAAQRGQLSVVAVIGSLYPVATVILAWIIIKERLNRIQLVGVALALFAAATLSLSS